MRREDIVKTLFYCDNRCFKDTSIKGCEECTSIMFAEYEKELIEDFIKFATKEWFCDHFRTCSEEDYYWLLKDIAKLFMKKKLK